MKNLLYSALFILSSLSFMAQTDGISYQAVIISPDVQELPGVDAQGNILPNATIAMRFTIFDKDDAIEFQEEQITETDAYGRINLVIGSVNKDDFTAISWDGTVKNLLVEIDFEGGDAYLELSEQQLLFIPYAYHRNITATGTLKVDGNTELNSSLRVEGVTTLNDSLIVNAPMELNDNLNVEGATHLHDSLTVEGPSLLNNKLQVEGMTELNDELSVQGITHLNDSLIVGGSTRLDSKLYVEGLTELNNSLKVNNNTLLEGNLTVQDEGTSRFFGKVRIDSTAIFYDNITVQASATASFLGPVNFEGPSSFSAINVDGPSELNGKVTIEANPGNGEEDEMDNYPLLVQGSKQGIAIKVNGSRSIDNNYISFWDEDTGEMWGRIEGLTLLEQVTDLSWNLAHADKLYNIVIASAEVGLFAGNLVYSSVDLGLTISDVRACVGLGACVVAPSPQRTSAKVLKTVLVVVEGVVKGVNLGKAIIDEGVFVGSSIAGIGVSYQSGAGDYAEWLPKQNSTDVFVPGELVGIKNGQVSKQTWGAEKVMIVSTNPIVLGNMPQPNNEANSVMVAFMGQVPVKVLGNVEPGDYIIPNLFVEGSARAVNPKDMQTSDYKNVAGVAWNVTEKIGEDLSIVNVAVGLNTNDLSDVLLQQERELQELKGETDQLEQQLARSIGILSNLVPGYAEAMGDNNHADHVHSELEPKTEYERPLPGEVVSIDESDIVYFEISDEQIEAGINMARDLYVNMLEEKGDFSSLIAGRDKDIEKAMEDMSLMPIEEHPFWQRIDSEPAYKAEVIRYIQSGIEKSFHTHKKYLDQFIDFKVRD